jgi:hypothetical protein
MEKFNAADALNAEKQAQSTGRWAHQASLLPAQQKVTILLLFFPLTNGSRACYPKQRILEVFAFTGATKTFDFVAFF